MLGGARIGSRRCRPLMVLGIERKKIFEWGDDRDPFLHRLRISHLISSLICPILLLKYVSNTMQKDDKLGVTGLVQLSYSPGRGAQTLRTLIQIMKYDITIIDAAVDQLDWVMKLFLDHKAYLTAITLSSAAKDLEMSIL
ncbi:MAG: hypothetical protein R6W75_06140 [Smithellaceae bacterium]